ncbi:alanine symporter family domain protein [Streptococcus pneumoniae 2070335]|nr:alanine symporter family domain protein [Streptococcus pneumoniae 2070335]
MLELLKSIDAFAWGPPLLILLVGTGIYLTIRLGLLQVLRLPKAFQLILSRIRDMVMYPVLQLCVQPWHQLLEQEIS